MDPWEATSSALLAWGIKTPSGFTVEPALSQGDHVRIVHRSPDGRVWLTLRSLTAPPHGRWRLAQRWYRRRYLRALGDPATLGA